MDLVAALSKLLITPKPVHLEHFAKNMLFSYFFCTFKIILVKHPTRDACLYMGGYVGSTFSFPHNSVTVRRIPFKFGRCMQ